MIGRLVIVGGTGDLTGRYLLPGLAALEAGGHLPGGFELVGASRDDWSDERYREWAAGWLARQGADAGAAATVVRAARYHQRDLGDPGDVAACIAGEGPVAVHLALPPAVFGLAVTALQRAELPADSQVVFEKPFGEDLEIEIVWDETLALEGRAGYYDRVGALKDMVQNHLLQLLCLVAMEPPITLGERDLRDRKVDVLRSVRPFTDDDVATRTRRARYRGYADEDGVAPEHGTETFAEAELALDSWRWSGTRVELSLVPLTLHAEMAPPELPAYGRILLDVLRRASALSIRADEAAESWRVVTPVLDGWARGLRPLEEYDPGSQGP